MLVEEGGNPQGSRELNKENGLKASYRGRMGSILEAPQRGSCQHTGT